MEINIETLKTFPILQGLDDKDLLDFKELLKEETFEDGSNIITENSEGTTMYILVSGKVDIVKTTLFKEEFVCASLDSSIHAVFGEMALIDSDKRSATVVARGKCIALSIDEASFKDFCKSHPAAGVTLLSFMSKNLVQKLRKENDNLRMVYEALIDEIESN